MRASRLHRSGPCNWSLATSWGRRETPPERSSRSVNRGHKGKKKRRHAPVLRSRTLDGSRRSGRSPVLAELLSLRAGAAESAGAAQPDLRREFRGSAGRGGRRGQRGFGGRLDNVSKSHPSTSPISKICVMLGWPSCATARASRRKRARRSGSARSSSGRSLIATLRSSRESLARCTSPMPPWPSLPSRV